MLQQMITDLDEQKRQAKQQMTEALALQKRLERDTEKEQSEAGKWEQKAILAVQNGKDDLAKEALVRKKEFERRALEFEKQLAHHKQNADVLRDGYQKLEDKIDEIKRKKGLLLAKQKQAAALSVEQAKAAEAKAKAEAAIAESQQKQQRSPCRHQTGPAATPLAGGL